MSNSHIKDIAAEQGIDLAKLPAHIGIIMDGNGRWARQRMLPRIVGHRYGAQKAHEIFTAAAQLGIKALTLYTFSQENWSRPVAEVSGLIKLFREYIERYAKQIVENGMRFNVIGDLSGFPASLVTYIKELQAKTAEATGTCLTLALGYGGRSEIVAACRSLAEDVRAGRMSPEDIDVDRLNSRMQTATLPELDFVIRTSGEQRVSNFLLWQIAYAELFFTEKYWPDFSREDFVEAISSYQARERRFGAIDTKNQIESTPFTLSNGTECSSKEY